MGKSRKISPSTITLLFILILVFSTFSYAFFYAEKTPEQRYREVWEKIVNNGFILKENLQPEIKQSLINNGWVIVTLNKNNAKKSFFENLLGKFRGMLLIEIDTKNQTIESLKGVYKIKGNETEETLFWEICNLSIAKPVDCAK